MRRFCFPLVPGCSLLGLVAAIQCGGDATAPTSPSLTSGNVSPVVTSVSVRAAANASMVLAPGQTRQLSATAVLSDGSSIDVTSTALWQSGDPVIATVSSGGILTAAAIGQVDVKATYKQAAGSVHAEVRKPGCEVSSLSVTKESYPALGGSTTVQVTTPTTDCHWTVASDVTWLPFTYEPTHIGSGSFSYTIPGNNYPMTRSATIAVTLTGGVTLALAVTQDAPVSCSYVVSPESASFVHTGTGSFKVTTTPANCQWTVSANLGSEYIVLGSATSGTGTGQVTYTVYWPYSWTGAYWIKVAGLSGANPPAYHLLTLGPGQTPTFSSAP